MKISVEIIPHQKQRYDTCGDWTFTENGDIIIYISEMGNWKYESAVAYHELREVLLCKHLGITQEEVDKFDIDFEKNWQEGHTDEPGDSQKAPYYLPHQYATRDERRLLEDLGENWEDYEKTINSL